jgi:hypothetical protein
LSAIDVAGLIVWWLYDSGNTGWKLAIGGIVGALVITGLPQMLRWADGRETDAIAERQTHVVQDAGGVAPLIEVIRQQQSSLAGQEQAQRITKRILDQYDQLKSGTDTFERPTGRLDEQDRLASAEHILRELQAAMNGTVQLIETPQGRGLIIKTSPNTFRITFPVPMRVTPDITFPRLSSGVTANVTEKSNIGFTVVFSPLSIPIEAIPAFTASADF